MKERENRLEEEERRRGVKTKGMKERYKEKKE